VIASLRRPAAIALSTRTIVSVAAALTLTMLLVGTLGWNQLGAELGLPTMVAICVALYSAVAALAAVSAWAAARRSAGLQRRVWYLFALGLACWSASAIPYITFIATGGNAADPAAWTQIGYLLAYPFWYRALWLLRQPGLEQRRARFESMAIELTALVLAGMVVVAVLWVPWLDWAANVALLVPPVLELLLVAGIYNALRRGRIRSHAAQSWLGAAFVTLLVTDSLLNYLIPRGYWDYVGAAAAGYAVAMTFAAYAATCPIRPMEMRAALSRSRATVAVLALGLVPAAALTLPPEFRPYLLALGVLLVWRSWAVIKQQVVSDSDPVSGFLAPGAFERHLGGLVQGASEERPVMVAMVELTDFPDWVGEHGFGEADAMVERVAERLQAASDDGVWGRMGPGRMAWAGLVTGLPHGRRLAEVMRDAVDGEIDARVGLALVPRDAESAGNVVIAAEEALAAATSTRRPMVAFDRGLLDGAPATSGYTTSLRRRRATVEELMSVPGLLYPVFQPVVTVEDLAVQGYEALSRFDAVPRRGPDQWIAEAHAVGLGVELEAECIRRALTWRAGLPAGTWMSLNVSPRLALSPKLADALGPGPLDDIVIEITEHERVDDYAQLAARLAVYRGRGARIAIDDAGAGHSSLRHVMQLRPDLVKLDPSLISDLDQDAARRALVSSMVALNSELGADLVAEGVESAAELGALRNLGVQLGQGYLFARPEPGFVRGDELSEAGALGDI
jgi:EAL domain-containing protein (putative c-di-GMP-specific phosphodiesterase class I)/GGDEF domain-containing protein